MKVPKAHFVRFKKAFLYWQKELGLVEYRASFTFDDLSDEGKGAKINVNHQAKVCGLHYSTVVNDEDVPQYNLETPEDRGLHEALHLLLWRLTAYGWDRFGITTDMLKEAEEEAVNRLVRIIKEIG